MSGERKTGRVATGLIEEASVVMASVKDDDKFSLSDVVESGADSIEFVGDAVVVAGVLPGRISKQS